MLALLVVALGSVCQAAFSPSPASAGPDAVVASSCDETPRHHTLCGYGAAVVGTPGARGGRADVAPDALGVLIAFAVASGLGGVFGAGGRMSARFRSLAGPPPWAPQRLVAGRHQLVAIGITRV
ncbi:hypothetical protein GCM10009609_69630 [Pseudonocardia aurantiaca]